MSGVNMLIIVGNLGGDPELKTVGQQQVCQFSVATNESWNDKNGNKQEHTEWTTVVVWGKLAEICGKYLKKGRQVFVSGRKRTRSWEKEGTKHYATELVADDVTFLGSKPEGEDGGGSSGSRDDRSF